MEPIINSLADDNSELLLSICIPTYNRANVLEECIKSIILQQGFDKRTEVIILDNSSTDNTKEIALSYTDLYPNILYFKNENNIGMEKNILEVLKYGKGKLLKLLNDYSLFTENKLENLLSVIISNKNEESILYFNNANNLL